MKRLLATALISLLMFAFAVRGHAAGDLARLCPADTVLYAEVRSPAEVLAFVEQWLKGEAPDDAADPMKTMLADAAGELKMTAEELRAEAAKLHAGAGIWKGLSGRRGRDFAGMWMLEFGEAKVLRDRVRETLEKEAPGVLATVGDVRIYGDRNTATCLAGDFFIMGAPPDLVRETVERLNAPEKPNLAQTERFRRALAAFDAKAPVFVHFDLQNFREDYLELWANDRDVPAVDALLDVKTIDSISGVVRLTEGRAFAEVSAFLNGPNGFYKALRTRAEARSVERFYSSGCGMVLTGTLSDGAEQWRQFSAQMAKFFEAMKHNNEFAEVMGQMEETLGTKIADELSNVTEFGMGMRFDPAERWGTPDLLFALEYKDADRMRKLLTKLEEAARGGGELTVLEKEVEGTKVRYLDERQADSDYAYAFIEGYVVASNRLRAVEDAVRTWKSGKCILDDESVKKVLAGLHEPHAKRMIMDFAKGPFMRRGNQKAAMAAATSVEHDLRIDARGDIDGILRLIGYEMRILPWAARRATRNVPREIDKP